MNACEFSTSSGERCRNPGAVSRDTFGKGPWFCSHHFFDQTSDEADAVVFRSLKQEGVEYPRKSYSPPSGKEKALRNMRMIGSWWHAVGRRLATAAERPVFDEDGDLAVEVRERFDADGWLLINGKPYRQTAKITDNVVAIRRT